LALARRQARTPGIGRRRSGGGTRDLPLWHPDGSTFDVERTGTVAKILSPAGSVKGSGVPAALLALAAFYVLPAWAQADDHSAPRFVDLSLLVAPEYPCTWPTFPPFQINHYERIGPLSPYHSEILVIDGNTGTQLDVPPHSVAPPDSPLPTAGPFGRSFTEAIPAWQFAGEACVIDCRDLRDAGVLGHSPLVKKERVLAWEKEHRPLGPGDVVLFRSDYSDTYYRAFPEGRRYAAAPVEGSSPAWPDPDPDCMEYLASRKVMTLGTDSASMGPLPDLGEPTHYAGLKHGMIWTESATGLGALPPTGAFYCILSPKYAGGAYSEGRALAVLGDPLARRLIDSARNKKVVDLSLVLADDLPVSWPGQGVGRHRQPFVKVRFGLNANMRTPFDMHMLDSHAGTHLVPPAYALPRPGFDNKSYGPEVQEWLAEFQKRYGRRGTSDITTEKVPLAQTCGPARVIDVRRLIATTDARTWPASPEINCADIQKHEQEHGELQAGDIVIFQSGWSDRYFQPPPQGKACLDDPINGKSEGWPAPGPDAVFYLARKGIRCVATDAPTLGGVDAKRALLTYWALGSQEMAGVEYLTNVGAMPPNAYFLFAAVKIRGCHGGHGRAIALY
jgi:kynurenine formamidase